MKRQIEVSIIASVLLLSGCATKKYVAQQVDPANAKIGEVDKNQKNTQRQLEADEPKISAADEKASSADTRATDAISRADAASKKSDQVRADLHNELNDRIANIDDYKAAGNVTVLFKFDSAKLTDDAKQQLDQLASGQVGSLKRYFVAIQGFTDSIGTPEHNLDLSRHRAEAVQTYLVGQHNIPVYRIQIVGLGKDKPVDEGRTREAREKNRRVEVTVFSADGAQSAQTATPAQ
ncbi:MAG TPA: OmpA family protein [Methylomirabilota bacterium]|jgi:outer membrane protein OmpA-like peptidoglycan-associated protein|nr:OmpA family protein [Methylomirabilota bacterium]